MFAPVWSLFDGDGTYGRSVVSTYPQRQRHEVDPILVQLVQGAQPFDDDDSPLK
jgi:hypothetical protein